MTDRFAIIVHESRRDFLTLDGLAAATGLHPELIERYIDFGLLEPTGCLEGQRLYGAKAVPRLRTIQRLREDIGVGLAGVAVILDLTDKIRELQREVEWLRNRM